MVDTIRVLAGLELLALTVGFWTFTLLFHVLSDWQSTAMGRHFMAFMGCCDLALTWSWITFAIRPSTEIRIWVALILYGALTFVVWHQVRLLIKMQIISRKNPDNAPTQRIMEQSDGSDGG